MAHITIPSRRAWSRQPPSSARLDTRDVKFIGAYSGQHGTVNLATGQALTRGTAVTVAAQPPGMALKQTVVNAGAWCPVKNLASVNAKYVALWHGVFVGAIVGSSPKLVGVSNSTTSQSSDVVGLERTANDTITVTAKLAGTGASRTFSVGASGWHGKTVTLLGFYEISTQLIWLLVNVDGVVSKYSSLLSFAGDPAPTILGTEQFCVGTEVVENPTRSPNVHTALAACFYGSVHNEWLEARLRNPWRLFAPRRSDAFVSLGGGSTLNASAAGQSTASGAASLAAQVALAAVGVSIASGTAAASGSSNIPLSATGLAVSSGAANPSATVTISAAGLAQAAGQAGLSASVLLAGAAAAQASGNAALAAQLTVLASGAAAVAGTAHLTGSAPGELAADGDAVAGGSAVLQVTVVLQATGAGQASGLANAQAGAAGAISAAGGAVADGSASTSVLVTLTAAGFVRAMGTGYARFDVAVDDFQNVTSNPKYIVRAKPRHYTVPAARRNYTVGAL